MGCSGFVCALLYFELFYMFTNLLLRLLSPDFCWFCGSSIPCPTPAPAPAPSPTSSVSATDRSSSGERENNAKGNEPISGQLGANDAKRDMEVVTVETRFSETLGRMVIALDQTRYVVCRLPFKPAGLCVALNVLSLVAHRMYEFTLRSSRTGHFATYASLKTL